jgi:uncharacterized paraquat-inducible protein A
MNNEQNTCNQCQTTEGVTIDYGDYALCDQCGSDLHELTKEPN